MPPTTLDLSFVQMTPHIRWVYGEYGKLASAGKIGRPHTRAVDYKRWSLVYNKLQDGASLIDVGPGAGQFVNAAARFGRFHSILALDIKPHSSLQHLSPHWTLAFYNIARQHKHHPFTAHTVTCLQTLAYLPESQTADALQTLTSLATNQLILTVPIHPEALLPKSHKQRFTVERVCNLWPQSVVTVLTTQGLPSYAIVEIHV